jgi:hypothetical protein
LGYTAVNVRGAAGVGGTGRVGSVTAVRGPAGNVVTAGRGAAYVNGQFVGGRAWTAVNGAYNRWGYFRPGYYGRYPGAWWPGKWAVVGSAWAGAAWGTAGGYCGCEDDGTYYDYEDNVSYDDGSVYYEGEPVGTAEEYYQQAEAIADAGPEFVDAAETDAGAETKEEDWLPLGVFALIKEAGQTQTDKVLQLALNKDGAIRGNLQDSLTDKVTQLVGSVDKKSQRVAIKLEGNESLVLEAGLYNLTNDEVPALVHFDAERQQAVTLIRLKQPKEDQQK